MCTAAAQGGNKENAATRKLIFKPTQGGSSSTPSLLHLLSPKLSSNTCKAQAARDQPTPPPQPLLKQKDIFVSRNVGTGASSSSGNFLLKQDSCSLKQQAQTTTATSSASQGQLFKVTLKKSHQ